jgi:hypothetical protein
LLISSLSYPCGLVNGKLFAHRSGVLIRAIVVAEEHPQIA